MTDLVCIGELLVDFVPSKVDRNLRDIDMFIRAPGGAPANVAAGFSRLGGKSAFVGKIGNDEFGHFLKETFCSSGVDTSCLIQTDEALTGLAFISLGSDSKHEFIFYGNPSADMLLKPEDVNTNKIMNTRILHFGSVSLSSSPAREATLEAVRFASVNNKVVSFDPNLRPALWDNLVCAKKEIGRGLEYANLLKVSQKEMNFISDLNQQNTNLGANNLFAKYPRLQVITVTRGHGGAVIFIRDNIIDIPSFKIIPVDPTGAGDAFTAALLYKINNALIAMNEYSLTNLNDADFWLKTGQFASAAGAITASLPGALNSMPTKKQLMSFLNRQLPK